MQRRMMSLMNNLNTSNRRQTSRGPKFKKLISMLSHHMHPRLTTLLTRLNSRIRQSTKCLRRIHTPLQRLHVYHKQTFRRRRLMNNATIITNRRQIRSQVNRALTKQQQSTFANLRSSLLNHHRPSVNLNSKPTNINISRTINRPSRRRPRARTRRSHYNRRYHNSRPRHR